MMSPFPPVPLWEPSIIQPIDRIVERLRFYTNNTQDFVVFEHGTCVIVEKNKAESDAISAAQEIMSAILHAHPDMNPLPMNDGNVLVQYNHPAVNIVLSDIAAAHWSEIEEKYIQGLAPDEVLITPLGQNTFDDFGKKALLGRAYFFMDAKKPQPVRLEQALS